MNPSKRSAVMAILGGMMAAAYLHTRGMVDLSFGFPPGGILEGLSMAITGAAAGYAVLLVFRVLRDAAKRSKK